MSLPTREAFLQALEPEDCAICFEVLSSPIRTECNHFFCQECARTWFESADNCPTCRRVLLQQPREAITYFTLAETHLGIIQGFLRNAPHLDTAEAATVDDVLLLEHAMAPILPSLDLFSTPSPSPSTSIVVNYEFMTGTLIHATLWFMAVRWGNFESPADRHCYNMLWNLILMSLVGNIWLSRGKEVDFEEFWEDLKKNQVARKDEWPNYPEHYAGKSLEEEMDCLGRVVVDAVVNGFRAPLNPLGTPLVLPVIDGE